MRHLPKQTAAGGRGLHADRLQVRGDLRSRSEGLHLRYRLGLHQIRAFGDGRSHIAEPFLQTHQHFSSQVPREVRQVERQLRVDLHAGQIFVGTLSRRL